MVTQRRRRSSENLGRQVYQKKGNKMWDGILRDNTGRKRGGKEEGINWGCTATFPTERNINNTNYVIGPDEDASSYVIES